MPDAQVGQAEAANGPCGKRWACTTKRTKGSRDEEHIQRKRKLGLAALSLCIAAIASTAEAQGIAESFEQLRVLVKPGDTVSVTDTAGRDVTGKIIVLSSSLLAMVVNGTQQELSEREVATIRQRRGDSLGNGAIWGLVGGAALSGTLLFFVESDGAGDASRGEGLRFTPAGQQTSGSSRDHGLLIEKASRSPSRSRARRRRRRVPCLG